MPRGRRHSGSQGAALTRTVTWSSAVSRIRRLLAVVLGLISVATFAVAPVLAAVENVTGTLQLPQDTSASRTAVAVITLTDRNPEGAGTIVGQQRIDGAEGAQIPFSVPFERDA